MLSALEPSNSGKTRADLIGNRTTSAGSCIRTVDLDRYRSCGFDHRVFAGSFPSRMFAAFSAIAMTAALVLPRTIEGITDAVDRSGPISTTSIAGHLTLLCLAEQLCRRRRDCADRQAADGTGPCPPPLSSAKDRRTSGGRSPRLLDLWPRERHVFRPVRTLIDPRA
jgi:hypothetical protein